MWLIYVILSSLFSAAYYFGNQIAKVSANVFMLYRGMIPVLFLLPFLPWVPPIAAWQFYVFCAVQGCVIAFIDCRNYQAMQKWGAEVVSAIHPLGIGAVFFLWGLLNPYQAGALCLHPWRLLSVVSALGCVIYATSSLKKSPQVKQALYFLLPFFIFVAVCDNLNKLCMSYLQKAELFAGCYYYILITGAVVTVINFIIYFRRGEHIKTLFQPHNLRYGAILLPLLGSMAFKNLAMFYVSNPSFVSATLYLYVLWIMAATRLFPKLRVDGQYMYLNRKKVLLLLVAASALVIIEK